jgi:hypothetical protein
MLAMIRMMIDDTVQCNDTPDMKTTCNSHDRGVPVAHFLCLASLAKPRYNMYDVFVAPQSRRYPYSACTDAID